MLPLLAFLSGYLVHVTLVGSPIAKRIYGLGIWLSTFGQEPPRNGKREASDTIAGKKSFAAGVRSYSPAAALARRGKPVATPLRGLWFVLVGWWLGLTWVVLSWSVFLLPYPFLGTVSALLDELPSVMTLATPGTPAGVSPDSSSAA